MQNFNVLTTDPASKIEQIYTTKHNALTLFFKTPPSERELNAKCMRRPHSPNERKAFDKLCENTIIMKMGKILPNVRWRCSGWLSPNILAEDPRHPNHDSIFHIGNDRDGLHYHFIKDNKEPFTFEEVSCVLKNIREKSAIPKKQDYVLTENDLNKILNEYKKCYPNQHRNQPQTTNDNFSTVFLSAFAYSFMSTLLLRYVQPYLSKNNYRDFFINAVIDLAFMMVVYSCTWSLFTAFLDVAQRRIVPPILQRLGVNEELQGILLATIMLYQFTDGLDFSTAVKLGVNQAAAWTGSLSAEAIIQQFTETEVTPQNNRDIKMR